MYSTDKDKPPKRPVVTSQAGALMEIRRWQTENQLDQVRDGDGLAWDLTAKVTQTADPSDPRKVLWAVKLCLSTRATAEAFIATGALDRVKDARLAGMMGAESIEIAMKPLTYRVATEEAAKALLFEVLPKLKTSFMRNPLSEVKRQLIGRWVDEQCRFGASEMRKSS